MKVIIAGGGVAGLACAIALGKSAHEITVVEQAHELAEVGAGLNLWPNAMKALNYLGASEHIRRTGVRGQRVSHFDLATGNALQTLPFGPSAAFYGEDLYNSHRADLLDALLGQIDASRVRLDSRVSDIAEKSDGVVVTLESGDQLEADLLVGADGLKSRVRSALFGEQSPRATGILAWRALIPRDQVGSVPIIEGIGSWFGPNRTAVVYPVRRGQLVSFSGYVPEREVHRESWTASGDVADLRESFLGACPDISELIGNIDSAIITPIYFREPLAQWTTDRVVLVGDAAHPVPPFAGQGAALALEDAVSLAHFLSTSVPDAPGAALDAFNRRRTPRARKVLARSRVNLQHYREADPVQARARDARLRGVRRLDPLNQATSQWLYGYDVLADADEAIDERIADWPDTSQKAVQLWQNVFTPDDEAGSWLGQRYAYDRFLQEWGGTVSGHEVSEITCDGVPALQIAPPEGRIGPAVFVLHGGGYVLGSARSAAAFASRLARAIGGWALVPDYRLAPEHGYPGALEDVSTAYHWLRRNQDDGGRVAVCGDDAGAGLALSLAVSLRDAGSVAPDALYLISPMCDLTVADDAPDAIDPWYDRAKLVGFAASYIQDNDPGSSDISPVHSSLAALPPVLIHVAAQEFLAPGAERLAALIRLGGGVISHIAVQHTVHNFPLIDFLPEAERALAQFTEHATAAGLC